MVDEKRAAPTDRELREVGLHFNVPDIEEVEVFVVDDERVSLELMRAYLERMGHPVKAFTKPADALEAIRETPPAILVTDIVMPGTSGIELAESAKGYDPDMGVILVTGYGDATMMGSVAHLGVSALLYKPLDLHQLHRAVQAAFLKRAADDHHRAMLNWMYENLARNAEQIREVTMGTLTALMNALDARSPHFRGHSSAVALQAASVAQELGLTDDEIESIRTAGLLHDVGMIGVPDSIVEKVDALMPDELKLIRAHCETGASIIEPMRHLGPVGAFVLDHHERWDGSGYPRAKSGDEISLGGQIVGIAEAWTAILENRAYRGGRSREEGLELLLQHQGEWFSQSVTEALIEADVGVIS
jgi:putative two-component system response regulator